MHPPVGGENCVKTFQTIQFQFVSIECNLDERQREQLARHKKKLKNRI